MRAISPQEAVVTEQTPQPYLTVPHENVVAVHDHQQAQNLRSDSENGSYPGDRNGSEKHTTRSVPWELTREDIDETTGQVVQDECIPATDIGSDASIRRAGGAMDNDSAGIPEIYILRRMPPVLSPEQDGISGFPVKAENMRSMGLVLEDEYGNATPVPYKAFSKSDVLQQIQRLGKDSDWAEHKSVLRACPLETLLVVHDPQKLYGNSFAWIFTEIAYNTMMKKIESCREEAIRACVHERGDDARRKKEGEQRESRVRFAGCISPNEWISSTSDITNEEIQRMSLQSRRSLITRVISKKYKLFKEPCEFQAISDKIHSSRPQKNSHLVDLRKELDLGIQAISKTTDADTQTYLCIPTDASTQYTSDDFWTKRKMDDQENKAFANFFSRIAGLVEQALEQNETVNIFGEAFANLGTDEFINSQATGEELKELLNFTHLAYSKSKIVSCIQRVPISDSLISYACMENSSFDERVERSGRGSQAHILVWHFDDIIMPRAVFSSPSDVTIFRYCEVDSKLYIVAGLISGQLALWKTESSMELVDKDVVGSHRAHQQPPVQPTKPFVISSIDFSHRRTVSDIRVLPPGTDFKKNLRAVFNPSSTSTYLITSSGDGNIMIWDLNSAAQSGHLENFQWRPFLQAPLKKAESGVDLGCCHLVIPTANPTELTTTFWASTEDGEVLVGDWAQPAEERKLDYVKLLLTGTRTCRPTLSFAVSPFFDDLFLAVTDIAFYIWMQDCPSPIFSSPTASVSYASGAWSPTRPSVLFLGRTDGSLEVWDLSEQCQACSSVFVVGTVAITYLSFHPCRGVQRSSIQEDPDMSLLAAGDANGVVHIVALPKSLSVQTPGEVGVIRALFVRERDVISYVTKRRETIKKELGLGEVGDYSPRGSTREDGLGHPRGRGGK
ncbi:WD domain, G-beta repeat-containing protein [Besnoitia besnoiti]|uniref:WD domain, G-beta repeat-containing protein n=1 Tax=Besnoitia besnoiti TaxID=94643 RepID=A0A2A9MKD2_BESBE|nr:WD domain, G-beta repeat-containing protein [Besnoitia besnoiti]PFH35872.1 WD domain, G-beta repeat-containing protein [Besnoitia besnoiti]